MLTTDEDESGASGHSLFSSEELALLGRIASAHDLTADDLVPLLDLERRMEHMGRRHGIHQEIRAWIDRIADRRLEQSETRS